MGAPSTAARSPPEAEPCTEPLGDAPSPCYACGPRMGRSLFAFAIASFVLVVVSGCGRKATREDCELIVDKNVEVKLKVDGLTDPDLVEKRKGELRASLKEDIDKCVGKRVTDSMLSCVKNAETPEQIDKCLR